MNKIGVCLFFSVIFAMQIVLANNHTGSLNEKIDLAYECLETQTNNRAALSLQEATFSILALGSNEKARAKLESEKSTQNGMDCWPKSACKIKETAQALLAYSAMGTGTNGAESYLISKSGAATGLNWFLLVDINNHEAATCQVRYNNGQYSFNIGEDMKISGSLGSCLSVTSSGYWMQISSSCLDNSYVVSCSKDFITTLLYQKTNSETIYVSPNTHTASSSGTTNESISSKCFRSGNVCDYEGTLWATIALDEVNKDVSSYLPYLIALSSENEKYLPDSFLYKLTNGQDHYSSLVQSQFNNQYWQAPSSPYGKFYDTALALLGLQNSQVVEVENSKNYLLNVQGSNGCWNGDNIRDTAFILYGGWPSNSPSPRPGPEPNLVSCESSSPEFSCVSSRLSCIDSGGESLQNYNCPGSLFCCSVTVEEKTCSQLGGEVCSLNEECSGSEVSSSDGSCCLEQCQPIAVEENFCESSGGLCKSSCDSDEEEVSESCTLSGEVCCVQKSGSNWTWIIILIILIAIVALAIIFRKRLALILHRAKRPSSTSTPMSIRRPPFPPSSPVYRPRPAPIGPMARPVARPAKEDKEMEDTLRKLKEMSK